ncbi:MAG: DUF63 family protein [Candidatus Thermoplasmatota archaeon]|nr:DUF63 family protein [Candidatus Thermoplasmatota archaeon]
MSDTNTKYYKKIILALIAIVLAYIVIFHSILVQQFFSRYFIEPIVKDALEQGSGKEEYNIFNTLVYGAVLVVALFLLYKLVRKLNFELNKQFFIALLPFIALGSILRVLEDIRFFSVPVAYLFISPIIYIFLGAIVVGIIVLAQILSKKYANRIIFITGAILGGLAISLCFLTVWRYPQALAQILGLSVLTTLIVFLILEVFSVKILSLKEYLSLSSLALFFAHFLDASATFVGINFYGYAEKHPLPTLAIGIFGAWIMYPLKFIVVSLVIYLLRIRYGAIVDENAKWLIIFCVFVLGLAPGIRDALRIGIGV